MSDTYTYELRDGDVWLTEFDVYVGYEIWLDGMDLEFTINALIAEHGENRINLLASEDPFIKSLAERIKRTIEQDSEWVSGRAEEQGFVYETRGGTDPEAHWRYARYA